MGNRDNGYLVIRSVLFQVHFPPTGSEERGVLRVGSIHVAIFHSHQE